MPVDWSNRNWHPYLADTVAKMADDGVSRAAAFVTSAYTSYSGCRRYIEDLAMARATVGGQAPELVKIRPFFNHPGFIGPLADGLRGALDEAGADSPVLFSAHSIPLAQASVCDYERQLRETARLIAEDAGVDRSRCSLVFQSRSGSPHEEWLGPDVEDAIRALPAGTDAVVVAPIGFVSDHMEVCYDLDTAAAQVAASLGIRLVRSPTPGTHPRFVAMIRQLVEELAFPSSGPLALGDLGPSPCPCDEGCCPAPQGRERAQRQAGSSR